MKYREYTNEQIDALINSYCHHERNRKVLHRRFVDGITYEKLSEEFDLSVKQIKNIVYKEGDKVFKHT